MGKPKTKSNYMAIPSSPKSKKRSPLLTSFKNGDGDDTAPNTPDDNGADAGGGVEPRRYDPVSAFAALTSNPTSPLRSGAGSMAESKLVGRGARTGEEEKKESEDVVAKTLAYFDHVCAAPKTSRGIKSNARFPEWGRSPSDDVMIHYEDETTTKPSRLGSDENSSSIPTSYQSTTATSTVPPNKGWSSQSPSQDHENFEVVLDPTSLPDEEEHSVPKRRWPFSKRSITQGKDAYQDVEGVSTGDRYPSRSPAENFEVDEDMTGEAENHLTDIADDTSLNHIERHMQQQLKQQEVDYSDDDSSYEDPGDVDSLSGRENDETSSKTKSIMKRLILKCRKLPRKISGKRNNRSNEYNLNRNTAEVQEPVSPDDLEIQSDPYALEEELLQGTSSIGCQPIEEGNEEDSEGNEKKNTKDEEQLGVATVTASASAAFNSLVATISNTFDEVAQVQVNESSALSSGVAETSHDELPNVSVEEPLESIEEYTEEAFDLKYQANNEPSKERSWGWKRVKQIRKGAKKLVKPKKAGCDSDNIKQLSMPMKTTTATEQTHPQANSVHPQAKSADAAPEIHKPKAIWKSATDPETGRTYYYHRKTRETTWMKPEEYEQYERDLESWKAWVESLKATADAVQSKTQSTAIDSSSHELPSVVALTEELKKDTQTSKQSRSKEVVETAEPQESHKLESSSKLRTKPSSELITTPTGSSADNTSGRLGVCDFDPEKKKEIEELLRRLPPPKSSLEQLMNEYKGREDELLEDLLAKVESRPFDEPDEEGDHASSRFVTSRSTPPRSPYGAGSRTMTMMSRASANTRSSTLTDRTEKVRNTGKGRLMTNTMNETFSTATSLSSRLNEDPIRFAQSNSPSRIPSRVPVPRERQLMIEELTDARISAETYDGNGQGRGRIMRGKLREHVATLDDPIYDGDNDTDLENTTAAYETDTYGTDSVSALSETDTDFLHRKDNFDQARRRALDDAIEREDWELAAAISEGMRPANIPGGYEKAHSSWNQSELDKFIANNDWNAVKTYIARMREASKKSQRTHEEVIQAPRSATRISSSSKNIGARSQLQHKDLMSESSWTSDSQSSYESYDDTESEMF